MKKIIICILFLHIISLTACSVKTDSLQEEITQEASNEQDKPKTPEELFPSEILDEEKVPDEELIQKLPDEQKILFFRLYGMEGYYYSGFFIDNQGNKIDFNLPEDKFYRDEADTYSYISGLDTSQGTEYMSLADLASCYDNLLKTEKGETIYVNSDEACMDDAYYDWYGVIDDGETSPKLIWLVEQDATTLYMHYNSDEYAKKILAILFKYQNSQKE